MTAGYHRIGGDTRKRRAKKPKRRKGSEKEHARTRWREFRAARPN